MNLGPPSSDAADGSRDLVFVSYSHADAEWVQRLEVLLKPVVRARRLRPWTDAYIRVGNDWHRDITAAIERTRVALLLVSGDFLASDFIMDEELPALIAGGVPLAPVLVGDCLWKQVHELASVQWLHDPGRDGALQLVADRPGERDRRLTAVCERLIALVPEDAGAHPTGPPIVAPALPAEALASGPGLGLLDGVPGLPPGYFARDELRALIDEVVATETGAVGLTGDVAAVGLHGQGGIGKSVLACALARDEGVRARFPDGVFWVSVGEKADVLAVQLELLARLGAADRAPRSRDEARDQLAEVLRERGALLVVDDVWSAAAAQALRVTGPRGRVLYTSRDPQVLAATGARPHRVEVLSPAAGRAVAGGVLDVSPESLPAAADQAFETVGRVALAIALLAAAVRGGRSWQQVAEELVRDAGIFGDHPYANTFKAMQLAVGALRDDLASALLSLAVFPPATQIPIAAITRYWVHTRGRTAEGVRGDLRELAAASVLSVDERADGSAVVGFHDLQHDYLLLHAPKLVELHAGLLAAYRTLLPGQDRDEWWQIPPREPYIWDHLITHLSGAGEHDTVASTVTDPAYLVRRITLSGPHAAEADLTRATAVLPTHEGIVWWRDWLARHAHRLTRPERVADDADSTASVAPTMLAWLTAEGTPPAAVDVDRLRPLLPNPHLTVRWGPTPPATGLIRVLTGHTGRVHAVAWSPDGTRLATASYDGEVQLWDPTTGRRPSTLITGRPQGLSAVAWSPDGTRLATAGIGGRRGEVRLWDSTTGQHLSTLITGRMSSIEALAWSPDGTRLAIALRYGKVQLWDPTTGRRLYIFKAVRLDRLEAVAWSPDGTRLAIALHHEVQLWDPTTGHYLSTFSTGPLDWVLALAWSPDGTQLVTASNNGKVQLWDPTTGHHLFTFITGRRDWIEAVAWSPDGTRLVSGGDGEVRLWAAPNPVDGYSPLRCGRSRSARDLGRTFGGTDFVRTVAWSPDGTRLATASTDGKVRLWDLTTYRYLFSLTGVYGVFAVAWSPDGTRLATASIYPAVLLSLWDPVTGRLLSTAPLSPQPRRLRRAFLNDPDVAVAVAWSPDGTRLATVDNGQKVRLWDPASGRHLCTLTGHTDGVRTVAWSPDGTRLATAGRDGKVQLWDPTTRRHLCTLTGHTDGVRMVAWSPDGTHLATVGKNGKVCILDLFHLDRHTDLRLEPLMCVQWTSAGIVVGGSNGAAILDLMYT